MLVTSFCAELKYVPFTLPQSQPARQLHFGHWRHRRFQRAMRSPWDGEGGCDDNRDNRLQR